MKLHDFSTRNDKQLLLIIAISQIARFILVLKGGQYYWPDEFRYNKSITAAKHLLSSDYCAFMSTIFNGTESVLHKLINVLPALIQVTTVESPYIPSLFNSLFSTVCVYFLYLICIRLDLSRRQALFASLMLACSSSFTYYSRHLLPYDMSMAAGLASIFIGLKKAPRKVNDYSCGAMAAVCFFIYAGYWTMSVASIFTLLFAANKTPKKIATRFLSYSTGAFTVGAIIFLANYSIRGDTVESYMFLASTIKQGLFFEGWILPFKYIWHAEHISAVAWLFCLTISLFKPEKLRVNKALLFSVNVFLMIYGALVIFSVVLEQFVVYGRLARQLVPFCCIVTTAVASSMVRQASRTVIMLLVLGVVVQGAWNIRLPFLQTFPYDFWDKMVKHYGYVADDIRYCFVNVKHIYPIPDAKHCNGVLVYEAEHPLKYKPYQYEGYTPEQRHLLRSHDIRMKLYIRHD